MSEVTAKDLRQWIEWGWWQLTGSAKKNAREKAELAAFDAMAEKAANYDRFETALEEYGYIEVGKLEGRGDIGVKFGPGPGGQTYQHLAEALKAVVA